MVGGPPGPLEKGEFMNSITCNKCGNKMDVSEALELRIRGELESKMKKRLEKREAELRQSENMLKKQQETLEKRVQNAVEEEKKKLEQEARKKAQAETLREKKIMEGLLAEKQKQVDEALKNELQVRKTMEEVEQKRKHLELEVQRKLDEGKKAAVEEALKVFQEDYSLKAQEKDRQIEDMKKKIDELKRKAEQGSQQLQGEVLEENTEALLKELFPLDEIQEVKKGQRGSDITHRIKTVGGRLAGSVLWECKYTQSWQDAWIDKAREDMREARAEIAIIATKVLPKGAPNISQIDGIWVCNLTSLQGMAVLIRAMVLSVHQSRAAELGKGDHKDVLYNYLTGTQFRQRMEQIVHTYCDMKEDLDSEKRALLRRFATREQQLEKILISSSQIYGDLKGIVGSTTLPRIARLELEGPENEESTNERA
jgi:hypothetical protein